MGRPIAGIAVLAFAVCGCATGGKSAAGLPASTVQQAEDLDAFRAVAESVAGGGLTDSRIRDLERDIRQDPDTRSAVGMITESVGGKKPAAKYSPATGKRYAPSMEYDPETGVKLLPVE